MPNSNSDSSNTWADLTAKQPLIPVWAHTDAQVAAQLGAALINAGYTAIEVTLRQEDSWNSLAALQNSGLTLIAGSLRHPSQIQGLQSLGINWAVSPGWCSNLARQAVEQGLNYLPGISTPGEAMQALNAGFTQVKLFPAMPLGGPNYLQALAAPLPELSFIPTGGINLNNLPNWLNLSAVSAVGGSWMLDQELINSHNWAGLTQLAAQALAHAQELRP